jgi:hypothetical protein
MSSFDGRITGAGKTFRIMFFCDQVIVGIWNNHTAGTMFIWQSVQIYQNSATRKLGQKLVYFNVPHCPALHCFQITTVLFTDREQIETYKYIQAQMYIYWAHSRFTEKMKGWFHLFAPSTLRLQGDHKVICEIARVVFY